jgi:hypothetical protein
MSQFIRPPRWQFNCAKATVGVDVKHPLRIVALNASVGRRAVPQGSPWEGLEKAAIPLRARNRLCRPKQRLLFAQGPTAVDAKLKFRLLGHFLSAARARHKRALRRGSGSARRGLARQILMAASKTKAMPIAHRERAARRNIARPLRFPQASSAARRCASVR